MILTAPNIWNKCLSEQPSTEDLYRENHQNYLHHPRDYHIITVVMPWHQSSSRTWPSRLNIRQNRSAPAATVEQCTAVIWLGIIRPAFEFPMCVPGQPASLASKHWLIHCVSAQTGRSISPPLDNHLSIGISPSSQQTSPQPKLFSISPSLDNHLSNGISPSSQQTSPQPKLISISRQWIRASGTSPIW